MPIPGRAAIIAELAGITSGSPASERVWNLTDQRTDEAMREIQERAARAGWRKLGEGYSGDGGSREFYFGRLARSRVEQVTAWLHAPAVAQAPRRRVVPNDDWGTISYEFRAEPTPQVWEGFPLCHGRAVTAVETTALGPRRTRMCPGFGSHVLAPLFGYTELRRPGSIRPPDSRPPPCDGTLWERGAQVVCVVLSRAGRDDTEAVTLVPSADAARLQRFYREPATGLATVDGGCVIRDARALPRPYRIEIRGHEILVNGSRVRDLADRNKDDQLAQFEAEVELLRGSGLVLIRGDDVDTFPAASSRGPSGLRLPGPIAAELCRALPELAHRGASASQPDEAVLLRLPYGDRIPAGWRQMILRMLGPR